MPYTSCYNINCGGALGVILPNLFQLRNEEPIVENTIAVNEAQVLAKSQLVFLTEEEVKREELIAVLAGLIKNYVLKQQGE